MTHTRTFTLEERALDALCARTPVKVTAEDSPSNGVTGVIVAIRCVEPGQHREGAGLRAVEVREGEEHPAAPIHIIPLTYGALEYQ
jgi:hypothetical protein